jgi:AAHS family 4-hydroxybenzoate transporter-like MFS transporter
MTEGVYVDSLDANRSSSIDLDELIDGQKVGASVIIFLVLAILAVVADGFNIAVMGVVAPDLVRNWHMSPHALLPLQLAGVAGLLIGAPTLGSLGDRIGRKRVIVFALLVFGGLALVSMAARNPLQLVVLRFLTGVGLGGLIPNVIALTAEVAPKRLRGMFIIIVNFGVPAGFALPGLVSASLVPIYGWPVLFLFGGLLSLGVCACASLLLPESIRYMLYRGDRAAEVTRMARQFRPDLAIDAHTQFTMAVQQGGHGGSPRRLFSEGLGVITPLLWIVLAANQFTNFFMVSWLPLLLRSVGAGTQRIGLTTTMYSIGGILGGLALVFIIDQLGVLPIVALFAIGVPVVALIGLPHLSAIMIAAVITFAGFCVTGNNFGINAVLGTLYPTPIRSMATGWGQALGRVGALLAQVAGGMLLTRHVPFGEVFIAPAASLFIAAIAASVLGVLCYRRLGGYRLGEATAADAIIVHSEDELLPLKQARP